MSAKDLIIPERTAVMGIVNVTEDSFSDGGRWLDIDAAIDHARDLVAAGADIIDVGGESTRPGATRVDPDVERSRVDPDVERSRVDPDVERSRVIPVIRALSEEGIATSIDTMRASVAAAAAEAGVKLINDVSGGLADRAMYSVMADTQLPVCLMHWKTVRFGDAAGSADHGGDVVADVHQTLDKLVTSALNAGVKEDNITIDPGLGFAKTQEDNWALLRALPEFIAGPYPVLVGASRKRFLRAVRAARGLQSGPVDADPATAAVTAIAAHMGAWCVRVHEVAVSRDAVDVAALWNA
ncbi:dihydropteroate synthase [Corynebacterium diphtheriae]|nr:dihydropteroate synthase [Corynebacterium diphtheriae]